MQRGKADHTGISRPACGTLGNRGYDPFRGPHLFTSNLSLAKNFRITERYKAEFRMDANNIFNHPVLGFTTPKQYLYRLRWRCRTNHQHRKQHVDAAPDVWTAFLFLTRTRTPQPPRRESATADSPFFYYNRVVIVAGKYHMALLRLYSHRLLAGALALCGAFPVSLQASEGASPKDGLTQGASSAPQDASLERSTLLMQQGKNDEALALLEGIAAAEPSRRGVMRQIGMANYGKAIT